MIDASFLTDIFSPSPSVELVFQFCGFDKMTSGYKRESQIFIELLLKRFKYKRSLRDILCKNWPWI